MNNIKNISFLGLGVMGFPMAGHLAAQTDMSVTVYNRTQAKAHDWIKSHKGQSAVTPAEAVREAEAIFICVGNDDDLRSVLMGPDGVIETVRTGAVIIDHRTVSAQISREMHGLFAQKGCAFIDAPVSGGQSGAENGQLTIMCGGDQEAFERVEPLIRKAYTREIRLLGPSGAGQTAKMVNQICIAGLLQGLSEGIAFGQKSGLDMDEVLAVISKGAAGSWQMDNRGKTMARGQFDFRFALDWMIKDLKIALAEGTTRNVALPVTEQALGYYEELSAAGDGRLDTSALIKRLR